MQVSSSLHYPQGYIYGSYGIPIGMIYQRKSDSSNYNAYTLPIRKCELMKLFVPFVSYMFADVDFTVAAPKYWDSLPDELRTISSFITLKCRLYSHMLSL